MTQIVEFKLADVGEGIAEAELIQWLVAVGDTISEDDAVAIIETDKSQLELPAPISGTVIAIGPAEGDVVEVGVLLLKIAPLGADLSEGIPDKPTTPVSSTNIGAHAATPVKDSTPQSNEDSKTGQAVGGSRPLASPSTRKLALQRGIDLHDVLGSGPHGRIIAADLDNLNTTASAERDSSAQQIKRPTTAAGVQRYNPRRDVPENTVIQLRGLRRQISRSMTEALKIPHITELREIDATSLLAARAALKDRFSQDGLRLSVLPFLIKACIWALARHPSFNARFDAENERVTQFGAIHFGMATSTKDGLIVPVLHDCQRMSLREISSEIDRLASAARARTAGPEELTNGTFTLTNFGSFGSWLGTPIIRPPEVAIVGFGRVYEKVVAVDGVPAVRSVLPLIVAADHRVNDGADLGAFVLDIAAALEDPVLMLDEL